VDLSFAGYPRKAAHFIPQQRQKRNPQSHLLAATATQAIESGENTHTL
jgi:hypothetical protein